MTHTTTGMKFATGTGDAALEARIVGLLYRLGIMGCEVNIARSGDKLDITMDKTCDVDEVNALIKANEDDLLRYLKAEAVGWRR